MVLNNNNNINQLTEWVTIYCFGGLVLIMSMIFVFFWLLGVISTTVNTPAIKSPTPLLHAKKPDKPRGYPGIPGILLAR